MLKSRVCCSIAVSLAVCGCQAQVFSIEHNCDSTSTIVLTTDSLRDEWKVDYPVYRFQAGDIDGDGIAEAFVGVTKTTRYDKNIAKRLFIFKNYHGLIRPMWMGSSLGHRLIDFRYCDGRIRAALQNKKGQYAVADYVWEVFGLSFLKWIEQDITEQRAMDLLTTDNNRQ